MLGQGVVEDGAERTIYAPSSPKPQLSAFPATGTVLGPSGTVPGRDHPAGTCRRDAARSPRHPSGAPLPDITATAASRIAELVAAPVHDFGRRQTAHRPFCKEESDALVIAHVPP